MRASSSEELDESALSSGPPIASQQSSKKKYWTAGPGSTIHSFELRIRVPLDGLFIRHGQTMRSLAEDIQPGGRFLFYDSIELGPDRVQILLVLQQGQKPDEYVICGELHGKSLPELVEARLQIDERNYETQAQNGVMQFVGIDLSGTVREVTLSLITLDRKPI